MAVVSTVNKLNYTGKGYLDPKTDAVNTLEELYELIPRKERCIGMTVTVLNSEGDSEPHEYWLVGGTANSNWVRKDTNCFIEGDDVEVLD